MYFFLKYRMKNAQCHKAKVILNNFGANNFFIRFFLILWKTPLGSPSVFSYNFWTKTFKAIILVSFAFISYQTESKLSLRYIRSKGDHHSCVIG